MFYLHWCESLKAVLPSIHSGECQIVVKFYIKHCAIVVLLRLECASESPGGLSKTSTFGSLSEVLLEKGYS